VIAAGARAAVPDVPGLAESAYYTNETIFSLDRRPSTSWCWAAGRSGASWRRRSRGWARASRCSTAATAAGARRRRRGPVVERAMARDGVEVWHGAELRRVEARGEASTLHVRQAGRDRTLETDALLVAAGRTPNVDGLGLEAAGVRYDAVRGVEVDDRLRTSNPRVYAVGDACSPLKFTHAADFQARLVVQNALFFGRGRASALVTPWVTYTSPEVAHVGLTEAGARERGTAVDVVTVELGEVDRAVIDDATEGFCRVLLPAARPHRRLHAGERTRGRDDLRGHARDDRQGRTRRDRPHHAPRTPRRPRRCARRRTSGGGASSRRGCRGCSGATSGCSGSGGPPA
jgi:hypothetical protein